MRNAELYRSTRLVTAAAALSALAACARRPAPPPETAPDGASAAMTSGRTRNGLQSVVFSDADRTRFNSVAQMIQARFSGVQVTPNGASYSIRINGVDSFSGSSEPLVIVDGATLPGTSALDNVNVRDVMKIEVLKNSAASIYGVRGGNGVIVVSTQRVPQR